MFTFPFLGFVNFNSQLAKLGLQLREITGDGWVINNYYTECILYSWMQYIGKDDWLVFDMFWLLTGIVCFVLWATSTMAPETNTSSTGRPCATTWCSTAKTLNLSLKTMCLSTSIVSIELLMLAPVRHIDICNIDWVLLDTNRTMHYVCYSCQSEDSQYVRWQWCYCCVLSVAWCQRYYSPGQLSLLAGTTNVCCNYNVMWVTITMA